MIGDGEPAHMSGNQRSGTEIPGRLGGFLRRHVDIGPARVVLTAVQERQVKPAKCFSDFEKMRPIPTVSAEKDTPGSGFQGKPRPKGFVF